MINFSAGSIAGRPLCCQQRTSPCTRREHGVPFFVRAPHIKTFSSTAEGGPLAVTPGDPDICAGAVTLLVRWMVTGGGSLRRPRPIVIPRTRSASTASESCNQCSLRNRGLHEPQNLRLVQGCQLSRTTLTPHSAQKFGR